jgi:hypothetical protein
VYPSVRLLPLVLLLLTNAVWGSTYVQRFSDLGPIVGMQVHDNDWVIRYQSTAGQTTCFPTCVGHNK